MKLNHDCVRDLMLYLEENLSYNNVIIVNNITELPYSSEEIIYTAEKLYEANFINALLSDHMGFSPPIIDISSITYSGHSFLDTIRDNGVWSKTKSITSKFTSVSLQIISSIASQIISQLIASSL